MIRLERWWTHIDAPVYSGIVLTLLAVLSAVVFGLLSDHSLFMLNAFLSGITFSVCVGVIIMGGRRVSRVAYLGCALLAAGLATSIPSLFAEDSPVKWGSTMSRLGLSILACYLLVEMVKRWRDEAHA